MQAVKINTYTTEDIYHLPDGERAELIDGMIYNMSPPNIRHQYLNTKLASKIDQYVDRKKGTCMVFSAPFAVFLNADNKTYVEPDISVICDKSKLENGRGCNGAPDWIIEIVSPSSKNMDYMVKLLKYSTAKVREYWIVDPMKNRIMVHNFENETMEEYTFADKIKAGIYEDLEIDFSEFIME